jgi:high-affinity Fe2+/Pb2+ permease
MNAFSVTSFGWHEVIMLIGLAVVASILFWGVITMGRGGAYNKNNSNKIMRYRIIGQAFVLLVFLTLLWLKREA